MTLQDFIRSNDFVIVQYTSTGNPLGTPAFHLGQDDDEYPFELDDIKGAVDADGLFTADDVGDATDHRRNSIQAVWAWSDKAKWQAQYNDWLASE